MPIMTGQAGKAEDTLRNRKSQIDQAVDDASGDSKPQQSDIKPVADNTRQSEKPVARPAQSKKWYE